MEGGKSTRGSRVSIPPTTSGWGEARRRRHEGRRAAGGGACGSGAGAQGGGRAVAGGVAEGMGCARSLFIGGVRRWRGGCGGGRPDGELGRTLMEMGPARPLAGVR